MWGTLQRVATHFIRPSKLWPFFFTIICLGILFVLYKAKLKSFRPQLDLNRSKVYCKWNEDVIHNGNGEYELHLCYVGIDSTQPDCPVATPTIDERRIRKNGRSRQLRFEELANIPDDQWLPDFDRGVYRLYPQSTALRKGIQSVLEEKPLCQDPIYNPPIRFVRVPSKVCPPITEGQAKVVSGNLTQPRVVIVYKSGVYNFDEREELRKLYHFTNIRVHIDLIFVIGLPTSQNSMVFQRDGFTVTLSPRAGRKLLHHLRFPSRTKHHLHMELAKYDDLLVGDFEDTYYNLTLKVFHIYQWAARFCRPYKPIFVFIDDDYAVNTNKLEQFVLALTPQQRVNLNSGIPVFVNPVFRPKGVYPQWAYSKREVPWPFHTPQHLGIYSMRSYRNVHNMALGMYFTKPMPTEDTWSAMVQYHLGLNITKLAGMYYLGTHKFRKVSCSDLFFALITEFTKRHCIL